MPPNPALAGSAVLYRRRSLLAVGSGDFYRRAGTSGSGCIQQVAPRSMAWHGNVVYLQHRCMVHRIRYVVISASLLSLPLRCPALWGRSEVLRSRISVCNLQTRQGRRRLALAVRRYLPVVCMYASGVSLALTLATGISTGVGTALHLSTTPSLTCIIRVACCFFVLLFSSSNLLQPFSLLPFSLPSP